MKEAPPSHLSLPPSLPTSLRRRKEEGRKVRRREGSSKGGRERGREGAGGEMLNFPSSSEVFAANESGRGT